MNDEQLYRVHWLDARGNSGHGSPLSHANASAAAQDGNVEFPNDEYWIEEVSDDE